MSSSNDFADIGGEFVTTAALDAVVFDGRSLLDPQGQTILSKDGSYDVTIKKRPKAK